MELLESDSARPRQVRCLRGLTQAVFLLRESTFLLSASVLDNAENGTGLWRTL